MFTRLLVPLDGTPESNAALPLARTQAHARGASIVLFQVADVFLATDEPLVAKACEQLARYLGYPQRLHRAATSGGTHEDPDDR